MFKKMLSAAVFAAMMMAGSVANAAILDFETGVPAGISLGGGMTWNGDGGGHLYQESWDNEDFIYFSAPTTVNSFQMNFQPWGSYAGGKNVGPDSIQAFDSGNGLLWSGNVDLTSTIGTWSQWITVSLNVANVSTLKFAATGGYWPSIDNMQVNQAATPTPIPGAVWLFGTGIAGLVGAGKRKKAKALEAVAA
jgi:hypothetical protein